MALPLVGFLAAVRGLVLRVVAPPYTARVFMGIDEVSDLVVLARKGRTHGVATHSATIRRLGVNGGLVLPPSFATALTLVLSGVRHRVGFAADGRGFLLSAALPSRDLRQEHLSENYLRLGREMIVRLRLEQPTAEAAAPRPIVFDNERDSLATILFTHEVPKDGYAVVLPVAVYGPTKHWPADKYRELVGKLRRDVPVVLAGGQAARALCDAVAKGLSGVTNLAGSTTLGELFALLEKARVVLANDSGAPHVAAALGAPVVVIFGSTSPTWTRPLGRSVRVVCEPVHCSPCFLRECPTQLECYQGITPDRVLAEVLDALGGRTIERTGSG